MPSSRSNQGSVIVNFLSLSGDVPRLPLYDVYISQLVRFARCCTSVLDTHSKNLQITSKLLTQGSRYHKLRKTFGKSFRSYSELLSKFGEISFQKYVSEEISQPVVYGDLVYKPRKVKCEANFVSCGSKIVKFLRNGQYDPVIIERTIGLVLCSSSALYKCTIIMMGHVQTFSEETRPWSSSPLIVIRDSFSPWTWALFQTDSAGCIYIFLIYSFYHLTCFCNKYYGLSPSNG